MARRKVEPASQPGEAAPITEPAKPKPSGFVRLELSRERCVCKTLQSRKVRDNDEEGIEHIIRARFDFRDETAIPAPLRDAATNLGELSGADGNSSSKSTIKARFTRMFWTIGREGSSGMLDQVPGDPVKCELVSIAGAVGLSVVVDLVVSPARIADLFALHGSDDVVITAQTVQMEMFGDK